MGHEYTGIVVEVGSDVKTLKPGDRIVSPFTSSWYVIISCQEKLPHARLLISFTAASASTASEGFHLAAKGVSC
jgi:threonine dehydrogenase-like Zn-dependent dehydrogenase